MTNELQEKRPSLSSGIVSLVLQLAAIAVAVGVLVEKIDNLKESQNDTKRAVENVQRDVNDIRANYNGRISVLEDRSGINSARRQQ